MNRLAPLPDLESVRAERARRHLRVFFQEVWPVLEPGTRFVPGFHLDAVAEHLEAITSGQLQRLLINMPPRHMKSLAVAVCWPMWEWIRHPERRWLFASYAQQLSTRDSLKCRRLIASPWYRRHWGHVYQLTSDQNLKQRFENNRTGYRLATSVGGALTGEGGDRIVVDDPHNVVEADSDAVRRRTLDWFDQSMSTRLNNPQTGAMVIVMQRLHEQDLAGHVLEQGGFEHLCLPAEYDGRKTVTVCGWQDPRTEMGALLWPARFSATVLADLKRQLGAYGTAGQLQQRPVPRDGGMFKRPWFAITSALPKAIRSRCRAWDCAATPGGGDWTVGVLLARTTTTRTSWRTSSEGSGRPPKCRRSCGRPRSATAAP